MCLQMRSIEEKDYGELLDIDEFLSRDKGVIWTNYKISWDDWDLGDEYGEIPFNRKTNGITGESLMRLVDILIWGKE